MFPDERRSTADGSGSGFVEAILSTGRGLRASGINKRQRPKDFAVLSFLAQTTRKEPSGDSRDTAG